MGKFMKFSILFALVGVTLAERASRGRQQPAFKRGVVLSAPLKDGDEIIEAEQIYGSGIQSASPHGGHGHGIGHKDQAFVVTGGYKVSDGVLDGSFGGVTHGAGGVIKYGYDHEGPHHDKSGHYIEYKHQPQHNEGFENNHLGQGYEQSLGQHFGYGPGPAHPPPHGHHPPMMHSHPYRSHGRHQHEVHHHSPPQQLFGHHGHSEMRFGHHIPQHQHAPSNHYQHRSHPMEHHRPPHHLELSPSHGPGHPGNYVGFRGYGNYSPAYSLGLSHGSHGHPAGPSHSSHNGYGYLG